MKLYKSSIFLYALLTGTNAFLFSQDASELSIIVSNIKSAKGQIMVAVYNSAEAFLGEDVVEGFEIPVAQKGEMKIIVRDLPMDIYAISVYHDQNGNGKLDSNFLRIPKEPYGFSNHAKSRFGPPSFTEAGFEFTKDQQVVEIRLK